MSKYSENKTLFKDADCLVQALIDMGFTKDQIEVHKTGQHLFDYHGSKTKYLNGKDYDKAEIIIRQTHINSHLSGGASNDFGFMKNADGTYSAIISEYDSRYISQSWMGKLKTNYAERGIMKQAKKVGLRYVSTTSTNGKRQVVFLKA
jgi:hypothetical protein